LKRGCAPNQGKGESPAVATGMRKKTSINLENTSTRHEKEGSESFLAKTRDVALNVTTLQRRGGRRADSRKEQKTWGKEKGGVGEAAPPRGLHPASRGDYPYPKSYKLNQRTKKKKWRSQGRQPDNRWLLRTA